MSKRGCRSSFTLFGVLLLAAALTLLMSSAVVSVQSSKMSYVDPSPPSGWYQCAGFANTAGDDIDNSFADDCQYSDGLRIRVWDSAGNLEEDVYATGLPKVTEWPKSGSLGTAGVKVKSTYWTAAGTFLTSTDGLSTATYTDQKGANVQMCIGGASQNGGLTISSGSPSSAIIAAGNTGYDEYIASCGYYGNEYNNQKDTTEWVLHPSTPLPDRKIAVYVNRQGPPDLCAKFADDLSKDKGCCVAKGFKWLKSGEIAAAAPAFASVAEAEEADVEPPLAVAYTTSEYKNDPIWNPLSMWSVQGYYSKAYLARSHDGGATWQSIKEVLSSGRQKYPHFYSPSLSGSRADDVDMVYVSTTADQFDWGKSIAFSGIDRAVSSGIDSGSPETSSSKSNLKSPSLKALDRDNLVASYIQQKPSSGTCGATSNSLKSASSSDGGKTWASAVVDGQHSDYSSIDSVSQAVFISYNRYSGPYATCGQGGYVDFAKSTDGGKSWPQLVEIDSGSGGTSLAAADAKNIFVAYQSGGLVKVAGSSDGGSTWRKVKVGSGSSPSVKAVSPSTAVVAYIGVDGKFKFAKSSDGGSTWATSTVDLSANAANPVIAVIGSNQVYIAYTTSASNNIIVARSYDGGTTWSKSTIANANSVQSLSLYVAAKAGKSYVDPEFTDSSGQRKLPEGVKLVPGKEGCSSNFGIARARECAAGACTSSPNDAALCDKASDCVYNGKCYSDIKSVAATFFSNELKAAWNSAWRPEVSADINGDGKIEVCDPGQWQSPTGTVAGTVTDSTTSAPISGATVNMVGTPPNQGITYTAATIADGTYTINNVNALTYDMTASATGYNNAVKANEPIQPFQTNTVDFQLTPGGAGGVWGGGAASISGTVTNITGQPVAGAAIKVLGTSFTAATAADGTYTIADIPSGTYDISAGKPGDGYTDATALGVNLVSGPTTVDFTLLLSLGSCTNDCSKVGSSACDASCDGKGACRFYSTETKQACDGTFGIIDMTGGRQVSCCKGQPYTPQKADVVVNAKQVIKNVKPVLYQGKLVNLITLLFIPDRQG